MIGHEYTTQQLRNRIDAGYTTVTYFAYADDQHAQGAINTWHKSYKTADRVAKHDVTNHLGIADLDGILYEHRCREVPATERWRIPNPKEAH